jgi:hypothetical protein
MEREIVLELSPEEEDIVAKMFRLVGKRLHKFVKHIYIDYY